MSSVAPTSPRPPNNLRTHSNSHTPSVGHTPTTNNNSNGEAMQVDALPPPPITIPMNTIKQSNRNGISSSTDIDRDDLPANNPNPNGAINSSSHAPHSKQDRDYSPSHIQSLSTRAHLAERRLAVLESTLSLPLTYPSALPSSPLDEKPDVSSVLKDPLTGEMDPKLRQAALAVKECEIRTDRAQALVVQRERELSRVRQDMDRLQAELNSVLAGRDTRDDLVRAKEDVARMREDAARSREMFERTREELHSAQNEIARLSSSGGPPSSSGGPPPYNNNSNSNNNKTDRQLLQAWDEADSFLRLCEGRMAEARALFSRILTGNRDGAGWLPPLPPPHQPVHHYPPGPPPPPPRDSTRMQSPVMQRTTPIVPSNTHAPPPPPPPPPTMNYPRPPNQHPHPRHRRDRSPGPDAYNVYDDDVREGERPNKRHRAISNAGRYYPDESFRSPPGGSTTHHIPPPPPPPSTNRPIQYNTYPDVAPAHPPSSHGGPHPPPPPSHPSHPSSQPSRHRSRSSSGSTSIDDMLLAASEVKPQGGGYHHDYKPRERGDSNASLGGASGHYPVQAQTQTHVFAPVQTGAPVKKGKTNPSLESIPATLAPQQFYPPTNEAGQRLCRQCGMTGRYKDNKCVEKWGPGPLGPGTVCDRCRKKMKRVERRGTLEGQQSAGGGAGGPVVYTHPISRTDTVVYPPPLTSSQQQSQSQPPSAQGQPPSAGGGGAHSPVKEHHHHSSHHGRNPLPPQHHASNPMPSTHGSNHNSGGPPPPSQHGHGGSGGGQHPHSNSSSNSMSQMRRPSPPPPIEVLHPSSRDGMDVDDRDRDGRDGVRDIDGDVVNDEEEIDDVDADADGDGEDIEGELLDAVDAAEKSQGGAD